MNLTISLITYKDYVELYNLICNNDSYSHITIDMSNHKFIKPIQTIMLVMFTIYEINNGCEISFIYPKNEGVAKYLKQIELEKFCQTNYGVSTTLNSIESITAMPIRRLDRANMNEYITFAQKYFLRFCEGKDLTMLNISIAELINNVYDHASSPIDAYAFCQYFPKDRSIKIVVGDLGKGIPITVNNYLQSIGEKKLSSKNSLKWAIEERKSTKSMPYNKGLGLSNLHSFIKNSEGSLRILSNDAAFNAFSYSNYFKVNPIPKFLGTIIEIVINIDNLEEYEAEEVDLVDLF